MKERTISFASTGNPAMTAGHKDQSHEKIWTIKYIGVSAIIKKTYLHICASIERLDTSIVKKRVGFVFISI